MLRRTHLQAVLQRLGAVQDKYDRKKWRTEAGVLSVNGARFFNWNRCAGGGGAIDLVMHLQGCDFKTAVLWLSDHFCSHPLDQTTATENCRSPALKLPARDDSKLPRAVHYLVAGRHIPPELVQHLFRSGNLYADFRGNAVFLLLGKEKRIVGAELRGTTHVPWRGMAPGSRKDLGYFSISGGNPRQAVLCESAIDAVSCFALHPYFLAISTSGANPNPAWLKSLIDQGYSILCGFDSDEPGEKMAEKMMQLHPGISRLRPGQHDWNDVLVSTNIHAGPLKTGGAIA